MCFGVALRFGIWHYGIDADVVEQVDTRDLKIECPGGNAGSRTAQIRGKLTARAGPRPIPSQAGRDASRREGVETRRAAPKAAAAAMAKG